MGHKQLLPRYLKTLEASCGGCGSVSSCPGTVRRQVPLSTGTCQLLTQIHPGSPHSSTLERLPQLLDRLSCCLLTCHLPTQLFLDLLHAPFLLDTSAIIRVASSSPSRIPYPEFPDDAPPQPAVPPCNFALPRRAHPYPTLSAPLKSSSSRCSILGAASLDRRQPKISFPRNSLLIVTNESTPFDRAALYFFLAGFPSRQFLSSPVDPLHPSYASILPQLPLSSSMIR